MFKILIIEDNISIKKELKAYLSEFYQVECIDDFSQTFEFILSFKPDLIILDLNLPIFDGHFILEKIRSTSNVPIIVVTSKDTTSDELLAMKLGADDYVHKPYHLQILHSRIENLLKRCYNTSNILTINNYSLDYGKNELKYQENIVPITNTESKILYYLFKNKNKLISKNKIMKYLWDSDLFIDENALAVNISRIRKKLPTNLIQTVRNVGYAIYESTT